MTASVEACCPGCREALTDTAGAQLCCAGCGRVFPLVDGIPILIDEEHSVFRLADFVSRRRHFFAPRTEGLVAWAQRRLPRLESHAVSRDNYRRLAGLLTSRPRRRVLVIGGGTVGGGMEPLLAAPGLEIVESDVELGPRTRVVLDAHAIPYRDGAFDGVVAQAVLEHVVDPERCVAEMHRVLAPDGLLYVETPFMQQVHGGPYDFTRYSRSGLRRLLRRFVEVDAGMLSGPGTALAWACEYLLVTLVGSAPAARLLAKATARSTLFWLKHLDVPARRNARALDAACGLYFLGRRSEAPAIDDRGVIDYYR